jgi:hypothetical protein
MNLTRKINDLYIYILFQTFNYYLFNYIIYFNKRFTIIIKPAEPNNNNTKNTFL